MCHNGDSSPHDERSPSDDDGDASNKDQVKENVIVPAAAVAAAVA